MKIVRLFFAAIALLGIVACQKEEAPVIQEDPEVIEVQEASREPVDLKSVASALNEAAEKEEVKLFIKNLLIMIREGKDPCHFEFGISHVNGENENPQISGSLGLVAGDLHPIAIDMDLLIMDMFPIVGKVDLVQISTNYVKAALSLDNTTCDSYLKKASEGIDLTVVYSFGMCFLRGEDEKGRRTLSLYLYNPYDPSFPPVPLSDLFKTLMVG